MAGDTTTKTMGDLAVLSPKDKDENEVFAELVGIIQNNYPSGWEDWKVVDLSHEELFGEELSAVTDSKLRFAIPSVELVKAFFPNAKDLSERAYRGIRKTLLKWPLGRALIYSPHSVVEKLHAQSYKAFMGVVKEMKLQGKLTNRDATSRILSEGQEQRSCSTPRSTTPQSKSKGFSAPRNLKRHLDIEEYSTPPPKKKPGYIQQGSSEHLMASVLQQQMEFFNKLLEMQSDQNRKLDELHKYSSMKASPLDVSYESRSQNIHREADMSPEPSPILCSEEEEESVQEDEPDQESLEEEIRKTDQRLKELQALKASGKSPRRHSITETARFNFKPHTTESEGRLSKADPVLAQQGMDCQRLGTDGWMNIKYKDVQKKFQATPVFSSLKVNNQLAGITPRWTSVQILEKMDLTLAAVTNGLLQQRAKKTQAEDW